MHREKKEKNEKVKIKEEVEEEDQEQHLGWVKEEPETYHEGLEPSVNSFAEQSSLNMKSEEDTEDDIPLVSALVT